MGVEAAGLDVDFAIGKLRNRSGIFSLKNNKRGDFTRYSAATQLTD
jgi:hypothetical protein